VWLSTFREAAISTCPIGTSAAGIFAAVGNAFVGSKHRFFQEKVVEQKGA